MLPITISGGNWSWEFIDAGVGKQTKIHLVQVVINKLTLNSTQDLSMNANTEQGYQTYQE